MSWEEWCDFDEEWDEDEDDSYCTSCCDNKATENGLCDECRESGDY